MKLRTNLEVRDKQKSRMNEEQVFMTRRIKAYKSDTKVEDYNSINMYDAVNV